MQPQLHAPTDKAPVIIHYGQWRVIMLLANMTALCLCVCVCVCFFEAKGLHCKYDRNR